MARSFGDRIRRALANRLVVLVAIALGLVLTASSIGSGLSSDDHIHRTAVKEQGRCLELFTFAAGHPEVMRMQKSSGTMPFYADDEMKVSFFRPLASLSHCIDYRYFDGQTGFFHAQNLFWFALTITAAFFFYRRTLSVPFAAGLATLFFAVDEGNGKVVGWIANRNMLMATSFGLLALVLHDRARREGCRKSGWAAPFAFAISLLSAEAGIATLAYLVSYALFLDEGPWKARLRSLVPHALLLIPWQAAYLYIGHGQTGSAFYTNPLTHPFAFAANVYERAPILLYSILGGSSADFFPLVGQDERQKWWLVALAVSATTALVLAPMVRKGRQLRFLAAGLLLSIVPACGTFPGDRLLMFASVGGMGLMAQFIADVFEPTALPTSWAHRFVAYPLAGWFALAHGFIAPLLKPIRSTEIARIESDIHAVSKSLFRDAEPGHAVVALTAGENMFSCSFATFLARTHGYGRGVGAQCLSATTRPVSMIRIAPNRVVVRPEGGFFDPLKEPFWNADKPMRPGHKLDLGWLKITITEVSDRGEPLEAVFHFHRSLDDPEFHLRYLDTERMTFVDAPVPLVGGKLVIENGQVTAFEAPRAGRQSK